MALNILQTWLIPVRALQLLLDLIVLGLAAALLANDSFTLDGILFTITHSSTYSYMIFVAVLTLLVTSYLLVVSLRFSSNALLAHPFLVAGLEALLWVFWLAAWAATAAAVNDQCSGVDMLGGWWCGRERAMLAFAVIEWILFCATAGYAVYQAFTEYRGGSGFGMRRTKGGPTAMDDGGVV